MTDDKIYREFIDWLGRTWWKLQESEDLMPVIKAWYSPEEAALLTGMPFSSRSLEELAGNKGMDPAELDYRLHQLAQKGVVFRAKKGDTVRYSLNDSFFVFLRSAFWPGGEDEAAREMAPLVNRYFKSAFMDQYADVHVKGLRALPIQKTIADTRRILPYEDVAQVLDQLDYFSVSVCPCRHRHNLDPDHQECDHPTEVCLHFGRLGRYIDDHGLGRNITLKNAHEILALAADSGLVHGVSNWRQGVDTICNCCSCCCLWMESYHVLGHAKSLDASNYIVETTDETCKACGLCVERCPMDALSLVDSDTSDNKKGQAASLEPDLCIGCGVCVHKCPTGSLTLEHRGEIIDPPTDVRDYMARFMADKEAAKS